MGRLAGKVAIVTGGAKGLGAAAARLFVREGATVVITDVDTGQRRGAGGGAGRQGELRGARRPQRGRVGRRLSPAPWRSTAASTSWSTTPASSRMHSPETISADQLHFVMAVSLDGTVWGCKYAIPAMRSSGGGSIVNMSSIASVQGEPYVAAYCAAKGAVEAYTRAVAVHCSQTRSGIRCNSVHPAGIDTPMVRSVPGKMAGANLPTLTEQAAGAGLNPLGQPDDIGNVVLFLASDESRFLSGQAIVVDNTASVTEGIVPGGRAMAELPGN